MTTERFANNAVTTLSSEIDDSVVSIVVASSSGFPTLPQFRILVGSELMLVTVVSGVNWTVTRGVEGSPVSSHIQGSPVVGVLTAGALYELGSDHVVTEDPWNVVMNNMGLASYNTVAMQAAINYGIEHHCRIIVPEGVVYINGPLITGNATSVYGGFILEGAGDGTNYPAASAIQCVDSYFAGAMLQLRGIAGVQVRNLVFDADYKADCCIQQMHIYGDYTVCRDITYANTRLLNGLVTNYVQGSLTAAKDMGDCLCTTFNNVVFGTANSGYPPSSGALVWLRAANTYSTMFLNCRWFKGSLFDVSYGILCEMGSFIVLGGLVEKLSQAGFALITPADGYPPGAQITGVHCSETPSLLVVDNTAAGASATVFPIQTQACNHYASGIDPNVHSVMLNYNERSRYTDVGSTFANGIQMLGRGSIMLNGTHLELQSNGNIYNADNIVDETVAQGNWDQQGTNRRDSSLLPRMKSLVNLLLDTAETTAFPAYTVDSYRCGVYSGHYYQATLRFRVDLWTTVFSAAGCIEFVEDAMLSVTGDVVTVGFNRTPVPDSRGVAGGLLATATASIVASTGGFTISVSRGASVDCYARWAVFYDDIRELS